MSIAVVGCNHRTAPVHLRERLAFNDDQTAEALGAFQRAYPHSEAVLLSTCNRTELYVAGPVHAGPRGPEALQWLAAQRRLSGEDLSAHGYQREEQSAVEHLFRVVSSLDSMVVGESQILGQAKQALALAERQQSARALLHALFTRAFAVAKEVHSTTAIGEGHVSVGSVALDFAGRIFARFDDKTVLLIGAGDMGALTLRHLLTKRPKRVWVTNRTFARAQELAERFEAAAQPFERLAELVAAADIVIASTAAPEPVLTAAGLRAIPALRRFRPLLLLDLGIPRNVEPSVDAMESIYLYNIDDLQRITDQHGQRRQAGVTEGERLIEARVMEYFQDRARRQAGPIITAFRKHVHELLRREWEWALPKLKSADAADREVIEQMVHRAVNKVLHAPTKLLNSKGAEGQVHGYAETLRSLFELPEEEEDAQSLSQNPSPPLGERVG